MATKIFFFVMLLSLHTQSTSATLVHLSEPLSSMIPVAIPSTIAAPTTVPSTNPAPTTVPSTNPVMLPPSVPLNPPVTNPATSNQVPPKVSGQSWCVAKPGTLDVALQLAVDYACGIGGIDCSEIQPTGSCYNPATVQAHASYAFNSYYQKNPAATSCDFGGAATVVDANPSSGTCVYPSSSSRSSYNPASSVGSGSGPTGLNTNTSTGSTDNPAGTLSNAFSVSAGWMFLSFVCTLVCIHGNSY